MSWEALHLEAKIVVVLGASIAFVHIAYPRTYASRISIVQKVKNRAQEDKGLAPSQSLDEDILRLSHHLFLL